MSSIKDWFKNRGASESAPLGVDDLIVLKRYDDAVAILEKKVKSNSRDLHARTKLAEVLVRQRKPMKAVEHYNYVAEAYALDGFHDKGIALLSKAARLVPTDASIPQRIDKLRRAKDMERTSSLAVNALGGPEESGGRGATAAVELQQILQKMAGTQLVQQLPADQLRPLLAAVEVKRVGEGEILARRGDQTPEMFIVAEGLVEAVHDNRGTTVSLLSFAAGDIVGESVLLEHQTWPATYRVGEAATLLRLTRERLEKAMQGNPDPRQLLEVLRSQHQDRKVSTSIQQLGSS